jgi:hypothetical protein
MYICPICGYNQLDYPPFSKEGYPSDTICPCCGTQFGYEVVKVDLARFKQLRDLWIKGGCPFFEVKKPDGWILSDQLQNVEKITFDKDRYDFTSEKL